MINITRNVKLIADGNVSTNEVPFFTAIMNEDIVAKLTIANIIK